jgi:hypothetical protein
MPFISRSALLFGRVKSSGRKAQRPFYHGGLYSRALIRGRFEDIFSRMGVRFERTGTADKESRGSIEERKWKEKKKGEGDGNIADAGGRVRALDGHIRVG